MDEIESLRAALAQALKERDHEREQRDLRHGAYLEEKARADGLGAVVAQLSIDRAEFRARADKAEKELAALREHWDGNAMCEGQRRAEQAEAALAHARDRMVAAFGEGTTEEHLVEISHTNEQQLSEAEAEARNAALEEAAQIAARRLDGLPEWHPSYATALCVAREIRALKSTAIASEQESFSRKGAAMDRLTNEQIAELEVLLAKATPGEWFLRPAGTYRNEVVAKPIGIVVVIARVGTPQLGDTARRIEASDANAALIAAAPTALRALLAEVRQAREAAPIIEKQSPDPATVRALVRDIADALRPPTEKNPAHLPEEEK
jgi:hypothetical protein